MPPAATKASRSSKAAFLSMEPSMPSQALPKLMAPSCNGETRMPAVLERTLYLPNEVGGSGAGSKSDMMWLYGEVGLKWLVGSIGQLSRTQDWSNKFVGGREVA